MGNGIPFIHVNKKGVVEWFLRLLRHTLRIDGVLERETQVAKDSYGR
jgi:hypothetical protein